MAMHSVATPETSPDASIRSGRLSERIETASASIDGVAAILQDMVQSPDRQTSRAAYACCDLLERISDELDHVAVSVHKLEPEA